MLPVNSQLEDGIIDAVYRAEAAGTPIELGLGPFYDRRLKRALGLKKVHQSVLCTTMKRLLKSGQLKVEDTGEKIEVFCGELTKLYPVMRFLPA